MSYSILYESCPWHTRVALFDENKRLLMVRFDDPSRKLIEGAHVLGRVRRISKALAAAFVDIGDVTDGFLPLKTVQEADKLTEGAEVMVRVTRGRTEGKGARLDARVLLERPENVEKIPFTVKPAAPALSRILMDAGDTPVDVWVVDNRFVSEVAELVPHNKIHALDKEDSDLLEHFDEQIHGLAGPTFNIPGGGRLKVEITSAVTSIDVDSGHGNPTGKNHHDTVMETNLRAAEEIARLCRLLDLGGSIIIDFISMSSKKDRYAVEERLAQSFQQRDSRKVEILKMSRFGLLEINRQQAGESLLVLVNQPAYIAGAALLELWRHRVQGRKAVLEASPDVASILQSRLTNDSALAYLGAPVDIRENLGFKDQYYNVIIK